MRSRSVGLMLVAGYVNEFHMGAPKRLEKAPDPPSLRSKRSRAKRVENGICKNSSRHGAAVKGQECLRCWAIPRAKRTGMTVEQVMEMELDRLKREREASNSNVTPNAGGGS